MPGLDPFTGQRPSQLPAAHSCPVNGKLPWANGSPQAALPRNSYANGHPGGWAGAEGQAKAGLR